MGALAKNPRERPASARAFATSLREYRTARGQDTVAVPVVPRPTPVQQRPAPRSNPGGGTAPMRTAPPPAASPSRTRRPVPVAAPPPLAQPHRERGSSGVGAFLLGLLLLGGVLGIAYLIFATPTLQGLLGPSPTTVVPTPEPAITAAPPATNTPVVPVRVPDLVGRRELEVVTQLEQLGLRRGVIGNAILSSEPAGTVIQQDPPPNTQVPPGSEVKILVSLGLEATPTPQPSPTPEPTATVAASPTPALATIPNLVGQPFEVVRVALQAAGFGVERAEQPSRSVSAGVIISQDPPPGNLPIGTTIRLVVSQGDVVPFPNVVGQDRTTAENLIRSAGFRLEFVDEQGPDRLPGFANIPPNQVVSATANGQPVQNGELVPRGASIVIGVRQP